MRYQINPIGNPPVQFRPQGCRPTVKTFICLTVCQIFEFYFDLKP